MKKILLFGLLLFGGITAYSQSCPVGTSTIAQETFDNTDNLTPDAMSAFFNDGSSDHFNVTDGSDISGSESGFTGFFFAAEDIDDNGGTGNSPQAFTISFDVDGFENLSFTGLFAQPETGGFDDADDVTITASIDGGASQTIIDVDEVDDGDASNQLAQIDGVTLTNAAQEFSSSITGTGMTLILTVTIDLNSATETIAFDNFTICGEAVVPTPVNLASFTAKPMDATTVTLDWATVAEENNEYFSIEHSIDGRDFLAIDEVAGAINSTEMLHYSYEHKGASKGINYYRLRQVDTDGTFSFSPIEAVTLESNIEIGVRPTIVESNVTLEIAEAFDTEATIEVYNVLGSLVASEVLASGAIQTNLNVSDLQSGHYFIRLINGSEYQTTRFIKR